jgi:hypothetical protein
MSTHEPAAADQDATTGQVRSTQSLPEALAARGFGALVHPAVGRSASADP